MKNLMLFITGLLFVSALAAQEQRIDKVIPDTKTGKEMAIGYVTRYFLNHNTVFADFYNTEYPKYTPDAAIVKQLGELLDKTSILTIMGTWCEDSQLQVPRFLKVIDNFEDNDRFSFLCVDRDKKGGIVDVTDFKILKVPTFIVYYDGNEVGRIVETPTESIEKDLLNILQKARK
jgi:thiol-disulfide isomerase/thioredoxin